MIWEGIPHNSTLDPLGLGLRGRQETWTQKGFSGLGFKTLQTRCKKGLRRLRFRI